MYIIKYYKAPSFIKTFLYSVFLHIIILFLLLSIPMRSGGAGPGLAEGFFISLNAGEQTLKTEEPRKVETTETATLPETMGQVPDDNEDGKENTLPVTDTKQNAPSDQKKAGLIAAESPLQNGALSAASPDTTAGKEKNTRPDPAKKDETAGKDEKPALTSPVEPPVTASGGSDKEAGPKEIPSEKQPLAMANRNAGPHDENKKSLADSSDQKNAREIKSPSPASPLIEKPGITMMEKAPARPLQKRENPQTRKEKPAEKTAMPAADTADAAVHVKNGPASSLISQNTHQEIMPAATTVKETTSTTTGEKTAQTREISPETVASTPTTMAAVQSVTDVKAHSSPGKQAEQNNAQKSTSTDLQSPHDTPAKPAINQGVAGSESSLKKTQPDHVGAAKVITPASETSHNKTLPLPEAVGVKTKPVSVFRPEGSSKIEAGAKPAPSPGPRELKKNDDKGPVAKKAATGVPGAAPALSAHSGTVNKLQQSPESGQGKSNGHIGPSPEMPGKVLRGKGDDKDAPVVAAAKAAPENALQSAPSLPERIKQSENKERLGIPVPEVLLPKDMQIVIYLRGGGIPSVFTSLTKKPYPAASNRTFSKKEEAVNSTTDTQIRGLDVSGIKHTMSVAIAEKGRYSFTIENRGKDGYETDILFHFYEGREKERKKEYRKIQLQPGAMFRFRFILPDAIFWDDDVFSAEIEDSRYVTKVRQETGLVWKEEKEPSVSRQPLSPVSQPIPVQFESQ